MKKKLKYFISTSAKEACEREKVMQKNLENKKQKLKMQQEFSLFKKLQRAFIEK